MKKHAPWPAPGDSRVQGPLSADHADEYIARAFRPRDPVAEEIELKLERVRIDQENRKLLCAVEQLERDRAEADDLFKQLNESLARMKKPKPKPKRGRPANAADDDALLERILRDSSEADSKAEFRLALEAQGVKKRRALDRYSEALSRRSPCG